MTVAPDELRMELALDMEQLEDEEVEEVEEAMDDQPMRVRGRVFLGSVDAAANAAALRSARVGRVLSLLGGAERGVLPDEEGSASRTTVEMEDSADEDLLAALPRVLDTLRRLIDEAEARDENVLVHCIAGRSRSPAVVVAWMLAQDPHGQTVEDAVDTVRIIRPWIAMNSRFVRDLHRFHALLTYSRSSDEFPLTEAEWPGLPRLDFDRGLVENILLGNKLVTMRLPSDVTDDQNSDLGRIFQHSVAVGTTGQAESGSEAVSMRSSRSRFALLRIDRVETQTLAATDATTLAKSGFQTREEVLAVLQRYYPDISMQTELRMVHFQFLRSI